MKKVYLIIIFFFGFFPIWKIDGIKVLQLNAAQAQSSQALKIAEAKTFLEQQNPGAVCTPGPGNGVSINQPPWWVGIASLEKDPKFVNFFATRNPGSLPPSSKEHQGGGGDEGDVNGNEMGHILDNLKAAARLEAFSQIQFWQTDHGFEPENPAPPCTEGAQFTLDFANNYYEGIASPDPTFDTTMSGASSLPCANKFLVGGNIIQFTASQRANIINYTFGGGSLQSVQFANGDNYERAVKYDVVEEIMNFDSYSEDCPDDYQSVQYKLVNKRGSYQFTCFPNISTLGGVQSHQSTGNTQFFQGAPDTLSGYSFLIEDSNIVQAQPGDQILTASPGGGYSCQTLDCARVPNGTAYTDTCGICVGGTTGKVDCVPCDSIHNALGDSLYSYLNKPEFLDSLNKFRQNTAADSLEKAVSLGTDSTTSAFKATSIIKAPPGFYSDLIDTWPGIKIFKMLHFHPNSAIAAFSAGDLYSLQLTFNDPRWKQIISQYLYSGLDSSTYAMTIEDSALYSNFLIQHPLGGTMDPITHDFDTSTVIGKDFDKVYTQLRGAPSNLSVDHAYAQASAYIMSKYNAGLVLYRQKKGETSFKRINTKVTTSSGNQTYSVNNCL